MRLPFLCAALLCLGPYLTDLRSGGEEVMMDVAGQDATEAFEDIGHSDEAREILDDLIVGSLKRAVSALVEILRP